MSQNPANVGWDLTLGGVKTYPLRVAFVLVSIPTIVWISVYVVFPAVVLAFVPVIGQVVYGDLRSALTVFVIVCGCLVGGTILMARSYERMGYEIDIEANTLRIDLLDERRSDIQRSPVGSSEDLQTDLADISQIEFFTVSGYTVARVHYPGRRSKNPYAFIVPSHRASEIESVLRTAGVPVSSDAELPFFERLRTRWQRFAVLVVSTGVLVIVPLTTLVAIALMP